MDSALYSCGRLSLGACVIGVPCRRITPNSRTPCPQLPHLPRRCLIYAPSINWTTSESAGAQFTLRATACCAGGERKPCARRAGHCRARARSGRAGACRGRCGRGGGAVPRRGGADPGGPCPRCAAGAALQASRGLPRGRHPGALKGTCHTMTPPTRLMGGWLGRNIAPQTLHGCRSAPKPSVASRVVAV